MTGFYEKTLDEKEMAEDEQLFHGKIKKMRLISTNLVYGERPGTYDEVEQHHYPSGIL